MTIIIHNLMTLFVIFSYNYHYAFVCKKPKGGDWPTPAPTTIPDGHCEESFIEFQGYCYKVSTSDLHSGETKDWTSAKDSCKEIGAELASVHSSREAAKLTTILVDLPDMDDGTKIWIGAHTTVDLYEWGWSDETRFTYTNWSPDEPNGYDVRYKFSPVNTLTKIF